MIDFSDKLSESMTKKYEITLITGCLYLFAL